MAPLWLMLKAPLVPLKYGRKVFRGLRRTRYQYGSLETKERKKGKEVWEFRYYEPDARGERQRRAVMAGSGHAEEYSTESRRKRSLLVARRDRRRCGSMQSNRVRLALPILER